MTTITTRSGKGSPLTNNEVDANFTNLNDDKVEASGDSMTGNLSFGDNNKAIFGAGSDLQIYHDGSNSFIDDQGTGSLVLQSNGAFTVIQNSSGVANARFDSAGAASLRYNGSEKLATTSTGIDVTGNVDASLDLFVGGAVAGNAGTRTINVGTAGSVAGGVQIWAGTTQTSFLQFGDDSTTSANHYRGYLSYNHSTDTLALGASGSTKVSVNSTGIDVTGSISADGLTVDGTGTLSTIGNGTQQIRTYVDSDEVSLLTDGSARLDLWTGGNKTMRLDANGDISFYEDTGTTAKFYWDASAESLGIGTTTPNYLLDVEGSGALFRINATSGDATAQLSVADTTSLNTINFGDSGSTTAGQILYRHNGDSMAFNVAGNEAVRILNGGNVGIGTSSPVTALQVDGTSEVAVSISTSGTREGAFYSDGALTVVNAYQGNPLVFSVASSGTSFTERMRIDSSGNVGIGTSPDFPLHVSSTGVVLGLNATSGAVSQRFNENGTARFFLSTLNGSNGLAFVNGDGVSERMRIDSSGNVGIGTSSPTEQLDVQLNAIVNESGAGDKGLFVGPSGFAGSFVYKSSGDAEIAPRSGKSLLFAASTGGTERMRLDSSGNLLVGTTDSSVYNNSGSGAGINLQNFGNIAVARDGNDCMVLNRLNSDGAILNIAKDGSTVGSIASVGGADIKVTFSSDGDQYITGNAASNYLTFSSANAERMRIDSSGNVGIGTSSPSNTVNYATLELSGATGSIVNLTDDGVRVGSFFNTVNDVTVGNFTATGFLGFRTNSTERMRIDSSGELTLGNPSGGSALQLDVSATGSDGVDIKGVYYTGSYGPMKFHTGGSERMRIASTGAVGIGTVPKTFNIGDGILQVGSRNTITSFSNDTGIGYNHYYNSGWKYTNADVARRFSSTSTIPFLFQYAASGTADSAISWSEAMRIDSSGNVGINQSSPTRKLHVTSAGSGVVATFGDSLANNTIEVTRTTTNASYIGLSATSAVGGIIAGPTFTFSTCNSGGGSVTERMRLDSSGNLLVGTTTASIAATNNTGAVIVANGASQFSRDGGHTLDINRVQDGEIVRFRSAGNAEGSISISGSTTSYNTSSDQRLKDNIVDAPSASDDIDAIQVRSFDWKADGSHQKYGMVAQELQSVAPEAVSGDAESDDMMGVDYSKLVPMLVKEIQSLRARVAQLEGEN